MRFCFLLCIGRCKHLGLLESFLSYTSRYLGPILLSLLFTYLFLVYCRRWLMWCMATSHILPVPKSLLTISKQLISSKQQAFFSLGLRNLHSEKVCLLVEYRAENISFYTNQSLSHQIELSGGSHHKESACNSGDPEVQSLGREDPLGKEIATYSSMLAWGIPWMVEPGGLESTGSQIAGHD